MTTPSHQSPDSLVLAKQVVTLEIQALHAMAARIDHAFDKAIALILAMKDHGRVVVVGMGKSGLIGQKIAATFASTGTPAFSVHPAEAFHGDLGMIRPEDVLLMISHSGETEELIRLLPFLAYQKNRVIAMVGNQASTLARHAEVVLDVSVEREACNINLAPTSSTTATLVMGDALAVVLSTKQQFQPEDFARFHPGGSLGRRLLTTVADVMHKPPLPRCAKEASFKEVVHTINRGRLGMVLVMEGETLCGVITDGDVRRAFDTDKDVRMMAAIDIMTDQPKVILATERVADAEEKIRAAKVGALVVEDGAGKVLGILQVYDVMDDVSVV